MNYLERLLKNKIGKTMAVINPYTNKLNEINPPIWEMAVYSVKYWISCFVIIFSSKKTTKPLPLIVLTDSSYLSNE